MSPRQISGNRNTAKTFPIIERNTTPEPVPGSVTTTTTTMELAMFLPNLQTLNYNQPESPRISASVAARLPRGWKADFFSVSIGDVNTLYKRAIDHDGFRWYWEGGTWLLSVPSFDSDSIALCEHVNGLKRCAITPRGCITLNGRRITPKQWNH